MQTTLLAGVFVVSCAAFSQTPAFEVASIKPAAPPTDGRMMVRMGNDPGRINYTNVSLRNVMMRAYKVKEPQIVAPDWMNSERFDIVAKLPEGATNDQVPQMLQALLADRFKLTIHREQKVMPVYVLVPAKGGVKLQPTEESGNMRVMMSPRGRRLTGKVSLPQLADMLSNFMDRPVIDKTETKGNFDIDFEWSGDEGGGMRVGGMMGPGPGPMGPPPGAAPARKEEGPAPNADAPSLFTAIQEKLGLRLDSQKAPVDLIVVDHAEKLPTEN
jgi:uncharacterized protein (TIGR03435 family)